MTVSWYNMTNQGVLICHRSLCGWLAGRPQEASTSLLQRLDRCVCSRELAEVSVHHPLFVYRSNRTCYHASKQHSCNGVLFGSFPQSAVVNSSELALRIGEHVVHCFSFAIDAIVFYRFHCFTIFLCVSAQKEVHDLALTLISLCLILAITTLRRDLLLQSEGSFMKYEKKSIFVDLCYRSNYYKDLVRRIWRANFTENMQQEF